MLTDEDQYRLRLALSVISGRKDIYQLDDTDYSMLGYRDSRDLQELGGLDSDTIKGDCEDTLFQMLSRLL